jgi:hypothetical protein
MKIRFVGAFLAGWVSLAASAGAIWVSPSGDDANPGTEAASFRTLEHALAVARTSADATTIHLADGTYRLTRPLVLRPGDPPIEIRAMTGANPVISGAVRIQGWTLHDKSRNIYQAGTGQYVSRHLYVDGRRATRARTDVPQGNIPAGFRPDPQLPNSSAGQPYVIAGGIQFIPTELNAGAWRDPSKWTNPRDVEAVVESQWKMMSVPLDTITPSTGGKPGLITLRQPAWTNANLYFTTTKPTNCIPASPGIWSLWQVTRFENAYEFLDQPGEWYLDRSKGVIDYIPRRGEDLSTADVEMPVLETLVQASGTPENPVSNIRFEGVTFAYATWLGPAGDDGYIADQSGFRVTGAQNTPNVTGHNKEVVRTPGNLRFEYARNIVFTTDRFIHLGAAGLDFGTGSQDNTITGNTFSDISSAAIQIGGVGTIDARPALPAQATKNNTISNNAIVMTGREYVDSAAIFIGFTSNTDVQHNTISHVPWSGIAIGWGWGLLDQGMFPGIGCAISGMWGKYTTPTINSGNRIAFNRISHFLENRWDGGAIYSTGQQGQSMDDPLVIEGNVADDKPSRSGGNTFYTDGGSRYVLVKGNASFDNPIGTVNLGPPPQKGDPLPYPADPSALNVIPYGSDIGGCRTYGDIHYENNYWMEGPIPFEELVIGTLATLLSKFFHIDPVFDPYSKEGFYDVCPYPEGGISYPTRLTYRNNHDILGEWEIPRAILNNAGVQR